jgi:DNA polymerase-3 subunit alpha
MDGRHFTHLHLHTEYSLLDGAISIEDLIGFGVKNNFKALAISDHGNIFGAVQFFQQAKKVGIKPVLGMEAYFTEDIAIRNSEKKYYHLLLIVENEIGYRNLCKLISYSYTIGFYSKPRIDYNLLKQYSEGLIVTSACLGGHIPTLLMQEQYDTAYQRTEWFLDIFGPERFYLEVQPVDQEEQRILNDRIFALSAKMNAPVIATGDCHYVYREDRHAHEVMLAVQTRSNMGDADRFTFGDCRAYMRTTEEMLSVFPEHPEVVWNTGVIADRCNFTFTTGKLYFPSYPLPPEFTAESYFTKLCQEGLEALIRLQRIDISSIAEYHSRLQLEIDLIITMGFVTYFLVVSDFIRWAKRNDIPVGPGRGSVAGSLVAWALEITDVDPIKYNLLFERFLNPERISMPDIDIDFCIEGRDKVIEYVRTRYGHDHVCQIITFGTMMAKGVIKDVARALGLPFEDSQNITDLIPEQLKITLKEAIEQEPRLKQLIASSSKVREIFDVAFRLEGLTRHASKHAAGVVITPQPVIDMLPVYVPPKSEELVTQYAMNDLELLGFLKMDFLGLKNLTLIKRVVDMIKQNHAVILDIPMLPLNDGATFDLIGRGETSGVFQLESNGLKDVLRRLKPDKFEDVIAVNALYRPGPLNSGMVDDFIARRHGEQKIVYIFSELAPILEETYGVIVYQEQVMHIASAIAGFSLGEADILRRAMGKKKADEMAKQKHIFVTRSVERDFNGKKAEELFDLMAYFAGYGFNKSHSTAYALIAYHTAYLKTHYPAEFLAALISLETSDPDTMAFYLQEAKSMGIAIIAPDINDSEILFTARKNSIMFGLQGIKHVGFAALEEIVKKRASEPFASLQHFCQRVDLRTVNKRVIESLIFAGAFDKHPGTRAQKHAALATIMEHAADHKKEKETGQLNLFGMAIAATHEPQLQHIQLPEVIPWSIATTLEHEKEVLGLFLTGHPLDVYSPYLNALSSGEKLTDHQNVIRCGMLVAKKVITTKKGEPMAFIKLEYFDRSLEVIIFPKLFKVIAPWLETHTAFAVKGILDGEGQPEKLKAQDLVPLDLVMQQGYGMTGVMLSLNNVVNEEVLAGLFADLKTKIVPGTTMLMLYFATENNPQPMRLTTRAKITITADFMIFAAERHLKVSLLW